MRIWQTSCDAEQVLAAVRDTSPVYYERCMNYPRGDMSVWDWPVGP